MIVASPLTPTVKKIGRLSTGNQEILINSGFLAVEIRALAYSVYSFNRLMRNLKSG